MTAEDLKIKLEQHAMWLVDNTKGARFSLVAGEHLQSANLQSASLSYANLHSANLRFADLHSANLRNANLHSANLQSADLHSANLRNANLQSVYGFKFTPLQIVNTKYSIAILDDTVLWGCRRLTFTELKAFELKDCTGVWDADEFKLNKKIITELIIYYRKTLETK